MSVTSNVSKWEKKLGKNLEPGERVLAHSEPLVILTNARIIELSMNGKLANFFPLNEIESIQRVDESLMRKNLLVNLVGGRTVAIIAGFKDGDWEEFQEIFEGTSQTADTDILKNVKPSESNTYGDILAQGHFGTRYVTIYSKGFVKVSAGMGVIKGSVEELVDIFGETDVNKKTGLGRAAGAVLTMGANLMLSPNQRGNLYLSISTTRQIHSLFWDRPDATSIKIMNKLVGAGKAALAMKARAEVSPEAPTPSSQSGDVQTKLRELADMYERGLLDEAEFKASKAKILGL